MAKRGRHRRGGRVTPKGTRPIGYRDRDWWPPPDDEPDLAREVRDMLRTGDALGLLAHVSSMLTLVDTREYGLARLPGEPPYSLRQLVDIFIDAQALEATAILAVLGELAPDELQRARVRRQLTARDVRLPSWLARLSGAGVHRAQEMVHVLGDGDNVNLAVRLADGRELTAVVYIDHNLGTLVKDAFIVPEAIDGIEALMRSHAKPDPDTVWRDLDLADARARIDDAIALAAMTVPPLESETWPACRPIVEWLTRRMPAGGTGYVRPEWSDRDRQGLIDRFFQSPYGTRLDDADHRSLLDSIVWFGADYGPGDPMRWSPVAVEIILMDWIPRKIVADSDYLSEAPDLLRAFIRFCHAERSIRTGLTEETIAAVDDFDLDYQRTIRSPRLQGPEALLAAVGAVDPDDEPFDHSAVMRELLVAAVGSEEALRSLDGEPLPDEAFDWSGIPEDVHAAVAEVLALCDRCAEEIFDVETRTAFRRLLARAARGDPAVFRRGARAEPTAAGLCWLVAKDNNLLTLYGGPLMAKDLMAHFGLKSSASQRAHTLLAAAGIQPATAEWELRLGHPELLVSARRRGIIEQRDLWVTDD